ncbi:rhodanese-like domain-containing protein [Faecalimicrobium dakarense]|uniref:rhodanese-like domain-containing protein n=1 Tax=Faecalimicrobium dakarense TaxID=1301100 RepID=UPI0004B3BFF7|nr:rhodanese-like domain-containing protein [[Clostridium] dakarense]
MSFFTNLFNKKYENIDGGKLDSILKDNRRVLILDVRTPVEFKSGHIPKAKNIPVNDLLCKINTISSYKDEAVVIYCASGMRSSNASRVLSKNGFNKVYNLSGGMGSYNNKLK